MTHLCHAIGCETPCRPEHLMCMKHWCMVAPRIQAKVYKHYRHGQCKDKIVTPEWLAAANEAISHVRKIEVYRVNAQLDKETTPGDLV